MSDRADWVYCRVVDRQTLLFPRPSFWVGLVEFCDYSSETACRQALDQSMQGFGLPMPTQGFSRLVRARVILPMVAATDVDRFGAFHIEESIRFFAFSSPFAPDLKLTMLEPGYHFNVTENMARPRLPPNPAFSPYSLGAVMEMDDHATHPKHIINTLLSAPQQFGELANAFRRASHWREIAQSVEDDSQAVLLMWMAVECLCKTTAEEDVCSKLLAALGFPSAAYLQKVGREVQRALTKLPAYRSWREQLRVIADGLRRTRNSIVHAGFRHVELSDVLVGPQLKLGKTVLAHASRRLLEMALWALAGPHRTVAEMWIAYPASLSEGVVAAAQATMEIVEGASPPSSRL